MNLTEGWRPSRNQPNCKYVKKSTPQIQFLTDFFWLRSCGKHSRKMNHACLFYCSLLKMLSKLSIYYTINRIIELFFINYPWEVMKIHKSPSFKRGTRHKARKPYNFLQYTYRVIGTKLRQNFYAFLYWKQYIDINLNVELFIPLLSEWEDSIVAVCLFMFLFIHSVTIHWKSVESY